MEMQAVVVPLFNPFSSGILSHDRFMKISLFPKLSCMTCCSEGWDDIEFSKSLSFCWSCFSKCVSHVHNKKIASSNILLALKLPLENIMSFLFFEMVQVNATPCWYIKLSGKLLDHWLKCTVKSFLSQRALRGRARARLTGALPKKGKMRRVATNVYLWKTSGKPKETGQKENSKFGSCIYAWGRY